MLDVVEPLGVKVAADIPLLLHHDSRQVVGRAKFGRATESGIPFEASLPAIAEAGSLKERVDEAWHSIKYGLITGVSIGFRVLEGMAERMANGGQRFKGIEVLELSLVPVPAQPDAVITEVRAAQKALHARRVVYVRRPGVVYL